jgi:hypothetical protein
MRSRTSEPPASGQRGERALPAAASRALALPGRGAVRNDFAATLVRARWFQVGAFLLSFLLMLALPARRVSGAARR